jgi:hypothetical protein
MKSFKLLIILSSLFCFQAYACSCADWEGASEMLSKSDTLVLGVPTDDGVYFSRDEDFGDDVYRFGINIVKKFKGKYNKFMYVLSHKGNGANCGVYFKPYSGLFLIAGYKVPGEKYYYTEGCSVGYVTPEDEYLARIIEDLLNK